LLADKVALLGKYVADITIQDVRELVQTHAAEDAFTDFKEVIFHPKHPKPNEIIHDLLIDLTAFANGFGGHIVVGIEDKRERAWRFKYMPQSEATRVAIKWKALAIQYIQPPIVPLEIVPFRMNHVADEWVVVVRIPEGQAKPHMSSFLSQTRFAIRDGNRNRSMTADEIQKAFLSGPQQSALANINTELRAVRALVEASSPRGRPWWRFGRP